MNLSRRLSSASRVLHSLLLRVQNCLPRQRSETFGNAQRSIGPIFVINLDRQEGRWTETLRSLKRIIDSQGSPLSCRTVRHSACDAHADPPIVCDRALVEPTYTLRDQLFVEPQPRAVPDIFDLERPIAMSSEEVAIACSHIAVWKTIAQSSAVYSLVLEDDVWFERCFGRVLDTAWREMANADRGDPRFDILYVSYEEVRHGAPKELLSTNVFRPERGLWYMSGYVLSRRGAQALLDLLPIHGPIDLWINQNFKALDVRALRRPVIKQRRDLLSTNSYSILPALSRIGVLDNGTESLFHRRPIHSPVFAFGTSGSGLSSLAMGLSMLGYRCCSDFDSIPEIELEKLLSGHNDRVFDAYVNIGSLEPHIKVLVQRYPAAKYIIAGDLENADSLSMGTILKELRNVDILRQYDELTDNWRRLCEFLELPPPSAAYPMVREIGQRTRQQSHIAETPTAAKWLRNDSSPWVAKSPTRWRGIRESALEKERSHEKLRKCFEDDFVRIPNSRWIVRSDTFPGNLGLFRPANVTPTPDGGISFAVAKQQLGVRSLSAAAISTCAAFLYGRFEVTLQATDVSGIVTGFFLHRNSPRQEIDIEILGNRPDQILVNVFYNPGSDGAKFDYGYRGTPVLIGLGFDASKGFHRYAIEWDSCEIRWFVDGNLIHRRGVWEPTPIPHLPMTLHVNAWPTASRKLAGRLALRALPASTIVRRVAVSSYEPESARGPASAILPASSGACSIHSRSKIYQDGDLTAS